MLPPAPARMNVTRLDGVNDIEQFFDELITKLADHQGRNLQIDLRSLKFMRPDAIMALVCAARLWFQHTGKQTAVHLSGRPHSYLNRIELFDVCEKYLCQSAQPDETFLKTNSYNVLEIFHIPSEEAQNSIVSNRALRRAFQILLGGLDEDRTQAVATLFSEISTNVVHSHDSAYGLIQRYPGIERIDIAVADLGVGIEGSLQSKYTYGTGSEYIFNALELGITSRDGRGGMGLTRVRDLVNNRGGVLTIRSRRSLVQVYDGECWLYDDLAPVPGVQVFLTAWGTPDNWRFG